MLWIDVDGRPVEVVVRRSPRATRGRLVVRSSVELELVLPLATSTATARRLLRQRAAWVARATAAAREREARPGLGLQRSDVVWVGGRAVPLVVTNGERATAILLDGRLHVGGPEPRRREALERWYRRQARTRLGVVAGHEAERLGVDHAGISIRDPRTRWASCSALGALSFSWRLLVAPDEVLVYVVIHELCHRRELNHSKRFWAHVAAACPDYRRQAAWLKEHGPALHAYVPGAAPLV